MLDEYERELVREIVAELDAVRESLIMAGVETALAGQHREAAARSHQRAHLLARKLTERPEPAPVSPTGSWPGRESSDSVGAMGSLPGLF